MPGSIPELSELGPQLEGDALAELRDEVRVLLHRRTDHFPGIMTSILQYLMARGAASKFAKTTL
jgi:hypothetical protein